jgi:alkylhydroperoxidase family enzyme
MAYLRIARDARRNRTDLYRWLVRRPALLGAVNGYEFAILISNRVEPRLKYLAALKASSLVGCPFWLDLGSAVCRAMGVSERKLTELGRYAESDVFDDEERLVLDLAVAMSATPARVTNELRQTLLLHFTRGQLAELASAIAWENHRARLNRALAVREMGFSDGAICVVPESL